MFRLFGRLVFFLPHPDHYNRYSQVVVESWKWGAFLGLIASVGYLGYVIYKKKRLEDILLGMWFLSGTLLFSLYQKAIYDYYLVILFPLPFLLFGNLVGRLAHSRVGHLLAYGIVGGLLILNWTGRPFIYPPNKQLEEAESVARFVFEKAEGKQFNFALITNSNSDHAYRYFFEIWGNHPIAIENSEKDPARNTVTDQLLIICELDNCKPLGHSLWEVAGFGPAEIEGRWDVGILEVYKLVHASR
jgi:hypothetical protein